MPHRTDRVTPLDLFLIQVLWGDQMPVRKVKGGYRWGRHGKVYKSRAKAERQGRAAHAHGYGKKKKRKKR